MAKKILGIDNLDVIRDFVLSKIMTESDDIKRVLTEENAEYLQNKLVEASNNLKNDYESKYESLNERIERLKLEGGSAEEIAELELKLDALENNYVDQNNALVAIENSIADIQSSVMSPGQLNELLDTALIEKTTITDDMVETPNVYTSNLVALIAKFGTVRALNIIGDEIEGKTISAYDKIAGTNEPTWKLDRQGDGYLANKNIVWDKNGNVTFGDKVKIGWGSVTDTPSDFGSGVSIFTSTVFIRTNGIPETPTGGSFEEPLPNNRDAGGKRIWHDGIPDGEEKLWASTRVFASDGGFRQQDEWSKPVQMTDTATLDIEYSSVATNPGNPTDNPTNWSNEGNSNTIWMATATITNGVKGAWTITKIKGEDGKDGTNGKDGKDGINGVDGKDGKDGTSISIAGYFNSEAELLAALPSGPNPVTNAYVVAGDLYVWTSGSWKNVGKFTGSDGKDGKDGQDGAQVYLHIKYADAIDYDVNGNVINVDWTANSGEDRGPYQGMYSDYIEADSMDFNKYKWFQIDAEKAVATEIGKYKITSNTISGKTIQTTNTMPLQVNTIFETFDEDGKSTGTVTSDGSTEGPAWQLRNMGQGYLANGNIRWDSNGNVTFGEKVKLGWDSIDDKPSDLGGLSATDVENIIGTKVTKDYIESKNIIATNISAATIAGKTILSDKQVTLADKTTGPTWKIMNDGTGYLANKNITWDVNGNLEVKGKLLGSLGNGSDDLYLDGTLAIIDNDATVKGQVLSALSGETNAYETYLDENDAEQKRFVTFATGFPEGVTDVSGDISIYRWTIKTDSIDPNYSALFTTNKFDDFKNGETIDAVYYYNGSKYILANGEYKIYTGQLKKQKTNTAYAWVAEKYLYSVDSGAKFVYNNVVTVDNTKFNILQSAKTKIYSDGSIVTDNILAEQGYFGGTIKSNGEFSGKLNSCTGSITHSKIKNSNISDSTILINDYNTLIATKQASSAGKGGNETVFAVTPKVQLANDVSPISYWWNKYSIDKQNRSKKDVLFKSSAKGTEVFKFQVNKDDKVLVPAMKITAIIYQPRKKDFDRTNPTVGLFVKKPDGKYVNLANGVKLVKNTKSAKYNKHQYTYEFTTTAQTFDITKSGECVILFGYDVILANKQGLDYAWGQFALDVAPDTKNTERCITVKPKNNDSNILKIGSNGIQIITKYGHKLTTTDGYIKMISENGKYGLQVDNTGVKILKGSVGWKQL